MVIAEPLDASEFRELTCATISAPVQCFGARVRDLPAAHSLTHRTGNVLNLLRESLSIHFGSLGGSLRPRSLSSLLRIECAHFPRSSQRFASPPPPTNGRWSHATRLSSIDRPNGSAHCWMLQPVYCGSAAFVTQRALWTRRRRIVASCCGRAHWMVASRSRRSPEFAWGSALCFRRSCSVPSEKSGIQSQQSPTSTPLETTKPAMIFSKPAHKDTTNHTVYPIDQK